MDTSRERLNGTSNGTQGSGEEVDDLRIRLQRREEELSALMNGAKAVLEMKGFAGCARAIFDHCCDITGATSGYVALLSDDGSENEVLFLEAGGLPCNVDPELPMPIRGLRAEAYHSNKAVYHNDFMKSKWVDFMPKGHVVLKNVMFAPLVLAGKTVGIIGLANKASDFDDNDARIATGFGELAAIALENSYNLDRIKTLSGLLPLCSYCKRVRDDKGYYHQIEEYVREHSDADFSHGICRECAEKHFPGVDLDED